MGNCLVKKLMVEVENNNLPYFDTLVLTIDNLSNDDGLAVKFSDDAKIGNGERITFSSGVTHSRYNSYKVYFSGTGTIMIDKKHLITELDFAGATVNLLDLDIAGLTRLELGKSQNYNRYFLPIIGLTNITDFNGLKCMDTLVRFVYVAHPISGSLDDLVAPALRILNFSECRNLSGTMKGIAMIGDLYLLGTYSDTMVSGTIEDFVAARVANKGQASAPEDISINLGNNTNITFKGTAGGSGNIAWEPSGDNTKITFNSQETIIAVAADGTWTRVS